MEPTVLPGGMKLAVCKPKFSTTFISLVDDAGENGHIASQRSEDSQHPTMVSQSLSKVNVVPFATFSPSMSKCSTSSKAAKRLWASRIRHQINTSSAYPIRQKPCRVALSDHKIISEQVQEMLTKGVIQGSVNPWASHSCEEERWYVEILCGRSPTEFCYQERHLSATMYWWRHILFTFGFLFFIRWFKIWLLASFDARSRQQHALVQTAFTNWTWWHSNRVMCLQH